MVAHSLRQRTGLIDQMAVLAFMAFCAAWTMRQLEDAPHPLRYAWSEHVSRSAQEKGMRTVTLEEAREIAITFSHILFDARKPTDFQAGHLPGAMSLSLLDFDALFPSVEPLLTPEQPVLVYCSGEDCDESLKLGEMLIELGYTNLTLFAGGMKAWQEAGYEVER